MSLTLLVVIALAVRTFGLGASGFSEDEINKLRAVEAYGHFDFSANAEHPMLMKLAVWASIAAARRWNAHPSIGVLTAISPEAALRLPNAVVGAATTGVVFLLAETLFDTIVAGWAALFWALDVNAAAISRIGKEDTFLVFFLLLGAYFHERGKTVSRTDLARRDRWFTLSGASFGLMLASKYMPHFLGIHALFNTAADRNRDVGFDRKASYYAAIPSLFLAANFAVLLPGTWRYLAGYARGDMLRHSGYHYAHRLFVNTVDATPWGLPPGFYLAFFATKVPLLVLAAAAVGLFWVARRPADRGATFVRVFLVFTLLPYSLVASKFLRYMLPTLAVIDVSAAIGVVWLLRLAAGLGTRVRRELSAALITVCAIGPPLVQQIATAPFYGLAQNALGARLVPPGWLFPDDEFYDAGVREAMEAVTRAAGPGAVVCSDATAVVGEYIRRSGRRDLVSCSIARDGLPVKPADTWVIAQEGHTYFESAGVIDVLHRRLRPWLEIDVGGQPSVQVFHLPR